MKLNTAKKLFMQEFSIFLRDSRMGTDTSGHTLSENIWHSQVCFSTVVQGDGGITLHIYLKAFLDCMPGRNSCFITDLHWIRGPLRFPVSRIPCLRDPESCETCATPWLTNLSSKIMIMYLKNHLPGPVCLFVLGGGNMILPQCWTEKWHVFNVLRKCLTWQWPW